MHEYLHLCKEKNEVPASGKFPVPATKRWTAPNRTSSPNDKYSRSSTREVRIRTVTDNGYFYLDEVPAEVTRTLDCTTTASAGFTLRASRVASLPWKHVS